MTIIKSCEELRRLLNNFSYEDIGFELVREKEPFTEYYKKRRYRTDLYVKVNMRNHESEVYTWNEEKKQSTVKKGTFNIHKEDELLFLLTHCLNELKVDSSVLNKYKHEINYDPTSIIPGRLSEEY